jgi:hypothetical protein
MLKLSEQHILYDNKVSKILHPNIEMLPATDQSIGNLMPDVEGWTKIKVS